MSKTGAIQAEELRALLQAARDAQAATIRQELDAGSVPLPVAMETSAPTMQWGRNFAWAALGFAGAMFILYAGIALVIAAAKLGR